MSIVITTTWLEIAKFLLGVEFKKTKQNKNPTDNVFLSQSAFRLVQVHWFIMLRLQLKCRETAIYSILLQKP